MIKVGVTGSNGFIGWHLCHTLKLYTNKFELIDFKRDWFKENTKLDSFVLKCDIIVHLAGLNRHSVESAIYNTNVGLPLSSSAISISQIPLESFLILKCVNPFSSKTSLNIPIPSSVLN